MTTGEKIRQLRRQAGMTQTELGEVLGVKKNAVSKWECGRVTDIPAGKIKAMGELFRVPPSYLIDNDARRPILRPDSDITDEDVKFALFGGEDEITDDMYREVKMFAAFLKERSKQRF